MNTERQGVFAVPGYLQFWTAWTVSEFGVYITTTALQVLVVLTLHGSASDVGLLNASRWLPYLLFGLVLGALVDRRRRKPILIGTDVGRGLLLGSVPILWFTGSLSMPVLLSIMAVFGVLSLLNDSASQSFLPRLVARQSLLTANARLDQSGTVAQTSGPLLAGGLITAFGAPIAILCNAATYLVSALFIARIRFSEPMNVGARKPLELRRDIAVGLRWIYGHKMLAPLIVSTHGWFLCNSMVGTIFVPFVLLGLGLTPFELGFALAFAGAAGFIGSLLSVPVGMRFGAGRTVITSRMLMPLSWAIIALAPEGMSAASTWFVISMLAAGQSLIRICHGSRERQRNGVRTSSHSR